MLVLQVIGIHHGLGEPCGSLCPVPPLIGRSWYLPVPFIGPAYQLCYDSRLSAKDRPVEYVVIAPHRSAYPKPLRFAKGTLLEVGQRYEGEPGWQDWYLCCCDGQLPGWVPAQVIERLGVGQGRALEHYSAHELDADPGQRVYRLRQLNGWMWCRRLSNGELGWLPLEKLKPER